MSAFKAERKGVAAIFGINLLLNILWSALYFGMHNPLYAFFDIILIIISIIFMIIYLWGIDRKSSALLVPYLLWVSFAGALNYLSIH
jgi:tryptophan-rich sensory protein